MNDPSEVVVERLEAQPAAAARARVQIAQLPHAQGEMLRKVCDAIRKHGATPTGPPFVRYHEFGDTETELEVGIPVAEAPAGEAEVAGGELPAGTAITTWHLGAHDRLGDAYRRLQEWLEAHGAAADGAAWEIYWWIDPAEEPDPSRWPPPVEWRTQLVQPIEAPPRP